MNTSPVRGAVELSPNAITVLEKRYLLKDDTGRPCEKAEDLFARVASTIAAPDAKYGASAGAVDALADAFYEVMAKRLFMPNSPTLMNAGRPLGQLSACFVLPVDDTLSNGKSGIYDTLRAMALVHQFVNALAEARVKHEVHTYPGAGHAFANPSGGSRYKPDAARDAWQKTLVFLGRYLSKQKAPAAAGR